MKRGTALRALIGMTAAAALALAGCGTSGDTGAASPPTARASTPTDGLSGTLTVFAAASLKAAFDQLRTAFTERYPNVDFPEVNYDGSATLVEQIRAGAPADVFASADEKNMDKVADLVTDRADFATNALRIAVASGNPKHVTGLADLGRDGIITVLCAPEVPCGAAAHRALDAAGVTVVPASEEQNVKAVLTKVASGDADAGLVYATDISSSGGAVDGVDFPEAAKAVNTYPIAVVAESTNKAAARAFVDLVTGDAGQQVLAAVGFGQP